MRNPQGVLRCYKSAYIRTRTLGQFVRAETVSVDAHGPLVLVHLDDNAVGISINKSAKFPFKIKDVFIGPIEF
jgi:hypothetical protein